MKRDDSPTLYELLPAVYRQRDAERGHPLHDLIVVLAEQGRVLEDDIEGLYRNWFVETCDDWVVPYIGDLLGVRPTSAQRISTRAEVANTLGYRRRKGTLAVLEQLARDVTGWPARAVEYFNLLSTSQHLNHLRSDSLVTPDLRDSGALSRLGGPFERTAHLPEVRRIETGAGRYNVMNIGIHLWRLSAYEVHRASAHEVDDGTGLHYTFSPLGNDLPLFRRPITIERPFDRAGERNVPDPISRKVMHDALHEIYGEHASIALWEGELPITLDAVAVCDLSEWANSVPQGKTAAIDPELGRIAFATADGDRDVRVRYHYGFGADFGGGSYDRPSDRPDPTILVRKDLSAGGASADVATIADALAALPADRLDHVIEIDDSSTYREVVQIDLPAESRLTIRAGRGKRPTLLLLDEIDVDGAPEALELEGLLIANERLRVGGQLAHLRIRHCTLVPGRRLDESGQAADPGFASLRVDAPASVVIEGCIIGAINVHGDARVEISDSIIDANDPAGSAYRGGQDGEAGGAIRFARSTVVGTVHAAEIHLATDTIFLGRVEAGRRQQGCLRFCHAPLDSLGPRRYRCQPEIPGGATPEDVERLALEVQPALTSLRYGAPGYGQLTARTSQLIRRGAEDESEMGAFSTLKQPQREDGLRIRLDEYLRLGMEAGIFYET